MAVLSRRRFLASLGLVPYFRWASWPRSFLPPPAPDLPFRISLAEWSLHRSLQSGRMSNLEFPAIARALGFDGVEYVNQFFREYAKDFGYLAELRRRCQQQQVQSLLIMCDGEGALGDPNPQARLQAVDNHRKWLEAAHFLGCHSIRVNAHSAGTPEEQRRLVADGLRQLCDCATEFGLHVLVENHGGLSSNGAWLASVIREVDHPLSGTLPDFGNFHLGDGKWYDRYRGVEEMMPFAKAVSAKSQRFDDSGWEVDIDYTRMLEIVLQSGYRRWIGVEYEGEQLEEEQGILATKNLLLRVTYQWLKKHPQHL